MTGVQTCALPIYEFATRFAEKKRQQQKIVFEKYQQLYNPSTDLSFKPFVSSIDYEKVKQDRILRDLEQKKQEEEHTNRLVLYQQMKPSSLFNYQTLPKDTTKSKFQSHFSI